MLLLLRRSLLGLLLTVLTAQWGAAQSNAEQKIKEVYDQFSLAYDSLDAALIAPLYTEKALYLNSNSGEGVRRGRKHILRSFRDQFSAVRARGSKLKMSFRIIDRAVNGDLAYDVGYYKFEALPKEGDKFESAGKFVTVLRRGADGQWRFHVDAFSKAPLSAYEDAGK